MTPDPEDRVDALLREMTLDEKVGQLVMRRNVDATADGDDLAAGRIGSVLYASGALAGSVRDDGLATVDLAAVQRVATERSRLGVPVLMARDVIHGHRTVVPIPLGLAATWDEELVERCAALAAEEAAADGVHWTFAPMLDLSEDPRWGRVAESLGEAPVLAGRLGAAMVRGFQTRIAACAKHFVGYGLVTGGRDYDTVTAGEHTLRNLHLRPFRAAVDAGVMSVMAAFTDVDGVPMHAHRRLLRDVLKGEWGFDGVVVADFDGVGQLVAQGVAEDLRDAARLAVTAGVDIDMASDAYARHLASLVTSGEVPVEVVDDAARRVLRLKGRLGLLDRPVTGGGGRARVTASSRSLARRAATASMVLLKDDGVLPLTPDLGRLHLTGPFVDDGVALLGTWVLDGDGDDAVTPAAAWRDWGAPVVVTDGRFSDLTLVKARECAVTVALVGEHPVRSGEDHSTTDLGLPPGQLEVLEGLAALGTRLVVVVLAGRPLDLGRVLELADAVVLAWHPGVEAGPAIRDVLDGTVAPSGRLPMTFPRSVGHVPTSTHQRPTGRPVPPSDDPHRGRYVDALTATRRPFGSGGSGSVDYGPVDLDAETLAVTGGPVTATVRVTNGGPAAVRELVQLYVHDRVAAVTRPLLELADWQWVELAPGEHRDVAFAVRPEQFGYVDTEHRWRVDPGDVDVLVGRDAAHATHAGRARLRLTP